MRNLEPSSPIWKALYEAALLETDATKLRDRIITARTAILDRIEESLTCPQPGEPRVLDHALRTLRRLSEITVDKRVA